MMAKSRFANRPFAARLVGGIFFPQRIPLRIECGASSPAVLAIEADYPSNPNYHTMDDLPGYLNPLLAEQILRMGGGALLRLAGSTAIFVDGFESAATLRWSATAP